MSTHSAYFVDFKSNMAKAIKYLEETVKGGQWPMSPKRKGRETEAGVVVEDKRRQDVFIHHNGMGDFTLSVLAKDGLRIYVRLDPEEVLKAYPLEEVEEFVLQALGPSTMVAAEDAKQLETKAEGLERRLAEVKDINQTLIAERNEAQSRAQELSVSLNNQVMKNNLLKKRLGKCQARLEECQDKLDQQEGK